MNKDFPNEYDLGRESELLNEATPKGVKVKKSKPKTEILYPSTYIYDGPEGLADEVRRLAKEAGAGESFYALVKIRQNRTTAETTTNREGETKEKSSLEFEIQSICLPDSVESEDESETESSGDDNLDLQESMDSAAKSLKIVRDTDEDEE